MKPKFETESYMFILYCASKYIYLFSFPER